MKVKKAHCFFEQSGTFKGAFRQLNIPAFDYDILNDYGQTDYVGDLFAQIKHAYAGRPSLLDKISREDIIIAFFPCTYFCGHNEMYFCGTSYNFRGMAMAERLNIVIERANLRNEYYVTLLMLCAVCEERGLRLIVENPYNAHHYFRFNFPYKPAVIDMNRRLMGDNFKKPTQYIFVNCSPAGKHSLQFDKPMQYVMSKRGTRDRSRISSDYAHNFICDHILGVESGHTQLTLFDTPS